MIDVNKNFTYDYIIFNVKNEDDFNIVLNFFELDNNDYDYSNYEECIDNGGFLCLCLNDKGLYHMSMETYENRYDLDYDISFYPELVETTKTELYNIVHFIKTGNNKPNYNSKKIVREKVLNEIVENIRYGFSHVIIGISNIDDINYIEENKYRYDEI